MMLKINRSLINQVHEARLRYNVDLVHCLFFLEAGAAREREISSILQHSAREHTGRLCFRRRLSFRTCVHFSVLTRRASSPLGGRLRLCLLFLLHRPFTHWCTRVIFAVRAEPLAVRNGIEGWAKATQMARCIAFIAFERRVILAVVLVAPYT